MTTTQIAASPADDLFDSMMASGHITAAHHFYDRFLTALTRGNTAKAAQILRETQRRHASIAKETPAS